LEVFVFLFLIVPSMVLSFFAVKKGDMSFGLVSVATILRDLSLVSLILFFSWRQSLVAPMIMHLLQDFVGIVLAPMLGLH
jgi:hypothetical protein